MSKGFTVAVASGKGGTGKTTIAVNLAHIAAGLGRKVQYLDCDVEEPNGHIFLKPHITSRRTATVDVPQVDSDKCTGCGECGRICQYGAIVHITGNNVLIFEHLCHSCGGCIRICPVGAIESRLLTIGEIELGTAGNVGFVHGRLRIGNVRTPSLIRKVKSHIRKGCLAIVDVPPGTSCPVVEAIRGADFVLLVTEPTPFGLNDLKLAVDLVRKMNLPSAVAINRYDVGNEEVEKYCEAENIDVIMKLPDDRRIAEVYSTGRMVVDALCEYKERFLGLAQAIASK
jgi:MinD superfamily P-loop ATPase